MTPDELAAMMPLAVSRAAVYAPLLTDSMEEFQINTPRRQAAFLPQIAHESGSLRYVKEIANGSAYEGRKDLGNTSTGDGPRYKGRGLLQITGKTNYRACGVALGIDLIASPELLELPVNACRSAGWFWKTKGLNELADAEKFGSITRIINGGYTGLDDRLRFWISIRRALGL